MMGQLTDPPHQREEQPEENTTFCESPDPPNWGKFTDAVFF